MMPLFSSTVQKKKKKERERERESYFAYHIWHVALPFGFVQSLFKSYPWGQKWPYPRAQRLRKTLRATSNNFALDQMCRVWCVNIRQMYWV